MKIFNTKDRKQVTPISEHAFVRPNKFIPKSAADETSDLGRQVYYEPVIVYTPVYVSKRTPNKNTLSMDDVDELNRKLDALLLGDKNDDSKVVEADILPEPTTSRDIKLDAVKSGRAAIANIA